MPTKGFVTIYAANSNRDVMITAKQVISSKRKTGSSRSVWISRSDGDFFYRLINVVNADRPTNLRIESPSGDIGLCATGFEFKRLYSSLAIPEEPWLGGQSGTTVIELLGLTFYRKKNDVLTQ